MSVCPDSPWTKYPHTHGRQWVTSSFYLVSLSLCLSFSFLFLYYTNYLCFYFFSSSLSPLFSIYHFHLITSFSSHDCQATSFFRKHTKPFWWVRYFRSRFRAVCTSAPLNPWIALVSALCLPPLSVSFAFSLSSLFLSPTPPVDHHFNVLSDTHHPSPA